jgi:hypothetical protein
MSDIPTVDDLLHAMISPQLSEEEAAALFENALIDYTEARDSTYEISLASPLFTPRAWWLMG